MLENLSKLRSFVDEMNVSNQTTYKTDLLKTKWSSDDFIRKVLFYTYNPYYQFYLTPETLEKNYEEDLGTLYEFTDLFDMLDALRRREVTGHKAINSVNDFCWRFEDYKDLIYKIIGKDLEIRLGDTLINKVIPGLIPTFDVALAADFDKVSPDVADGTWYSSRKMDGVRCLAIIDDAGKCTLWSRQGKQFETLNKVCSDIESLGLTGCVLDGEICLAAADGSDDFQGIMSQIRRKNHTIENPRYLLFDLISMKEFNDKKGTNKLSDRFELLKQTIPADSETLSVLEQTLIGSAEELHTLLEDADARGWEGLILRRNVGYEGKRGKNMLKCKTFHDAEYVVDSIDTGPFRIIDNGIETTIDTMTNVNITHKGNPVSVGSGWSLDERKHFFANPSEIVGKVITVKYFEESVNKNGKISLRFPTKKYVHGDKRLV